MSEAEGISLFQRMKAAFKILLPFALLLRGCEPCPAADSAKIQPNACRVSWEQLDEAGHVGAYGIKYDPQAMTCASRGWPCGTVLRITEIHNGLSVVVTVTDKNPLRSYRRGIKADLSAAAFDKIAGRELGLAEVKIEVLTAK